jgi:hypothetical protein
MTVSATRSNWQTGARISPLAERFTLFCLVADLAARRYAVCGRARISARMPVDETGTLLARLRAMVPSSPVGAALDSRVSASVPLSALTQTLELIDELDESATGALRFGKSGVVLVERGLVCWATAPDMRRRLTDLLRRQASPPLTTEALEALYRKCRDDAVPLGEELVRDGLITPAGLRRSLKTHIAEAVALIAVSGETSADWLPHKRDRYDARFAFSAGELLTVIAAQRKLQEASEAKDVLRKVLDGEAVGLALRRERGAAVATPLSLVRARRLKLGDLTKLSVWARETLDVCGALDPTCRLASAALPSGHSALAWQHDELIYVLLCHDKRSLARCLSRLETARALSPSA